MTSLEYTDFDRTEKPSNSLPVMAFQSTHTCSAVAPRIKSTHGHPREESSHNPLLVR